MAEHPADDDRLAHPLDAVLHLLDRQVVDVDDRLVCKVDDLELVEDDKGLTVTALLVGPAALVPRYGSGRVGRALLDYWHRLGLERADRVLPYRIDLDLVSRLGSGVELSVSRDDALVRQPDDDGNERRHRLNDLLQAEVFGADGGAMGGIIDVRVEPDRTRQDAALRVTGLLVGPGRPGSYLGYDRRPSQGPWLLNRIVRHLHRHTRLVDWSGVAAVDWQHRRLSLSAEADLRTPTTA